MARFRLVWVLAFTFLTSACAIDKAPTQPLRKVGNSPKPAPLRPMAPTPLVETPAPNAASSESSEDQKSEPATPQSTPASGLLGDAAKFVEQLHASHGQTPASALPSANVWLSKAQQKLLAMAKSAPTQDQQDLYITLLHNDLLLYVRDENGQGIFHWLAETDQVEVAKNLLQGRFKYNVLLLDKKGRLPLHYAHSKSMVDLLLRAGNDPLTSDAAGLTPLMAMIERDDSTPLPSLVHAICGREKVWHAFFSNSSINSQGPDGRTALHRAAARGNLKAVSSLLACGDTNVMIRDRNQQTALHLAVCAPQASQAVTYALLAQFNSRSQIGSSVEDLLAVRDVNGDTAETLASGCANARTADLLRF